LARRLSGKEKQKNITIRLGYVNIKIWNHSVIVL
jgi:translation initiation factor 2 gamma subunit (eIF-2gamma)